MLILTMAEIGGCGIISFSTGQIGELASKSRGGCMASQGRNSAHALILARSSGLGSEGSHCRGARW